MTAAAAAALAATGALVSAASLTTTSSAVDRLDPAPFATAPSALVSPEPEPEPSARAAADDAPSAPSASSTIFEAAPGAPPLAAKSPAASEPTVSPSAVPEQQAADEPVLVRSYDAPNSDDATLCGGRISSGIGPPRAETGWCVIAAVQQQPDRAVELEVRVCRSSEASRTDLHVDAGAAAMRLEQQGAVVWRLPAVNEPPAVLVTEPGGCWVWTHPWDGRADDRSPLPAGSTVLHVRSLAQEVRDVEDQQEFRHEP
jgi:hypothetical protein